MCEHGERGVLIFHCRFGVRCYARRNIRGYYVSRASQVSWLNGAVIYAEPSSLETLKISTDRLLRFFFFFSILRLEMIFPSFASSFAYPYDKINNII